MTSVNAIDTDNAAVEGIYNNLGMKTNRLQHGLNIVKRNDGTTHKVVLNK